MSEQTVDTGSKELLCTIRDGVMVITLNRPEAKNALSAGIREGLQKSIARGMEDPEIGALIITGAGTAFCAGGDVKGMGDKRPAVASVEQRVKEMQARHRATTGSLMTGLKPTIAALPGAAVGAGLALALACDIRIAASSAFVSTGYAKVGLSGDYGIAWLLRRAAGDARARELLLTCERVPAARAEQFGIVNRVVPDAELQAQAFALAKSLANGPRIALRNIKANINDAATQEYFEALDGEAVRLAPLSATADHKEAVRAFVEKRAPVFSDR